MGPNTQIFVLKNEKSLRMCNFCRTSTCYPKYKEFYVLGVGDSSHSRAALTPNTCHWQLFGAAQSLHFRTLPDILVHNFRKLFCKRATSYFYPP